MLVGAGADLNIRDIGGYDALTLGSLSCRETVRILLETGVDLNVQDSRGCTALMRVSQYASTTCNIEAVNILLNVNADPNLKDKSGQTVLMQVCRQLKTEIDLQVFRALLGKGVDVNLKNSGGYTALMSFCCSNVEAVPYISAAISELLVVGADPYITNNKGKIAFTLSNTPKKFIRLYEDIVFIRKCLLKVHQHIRRIDESRSLSPDGLYFKLQCLYYKVAEPTFAFKERDDNTLTLINYLGSTDKEILI